MSVGRGMWPLGGEKEVHIEFLWQKANRNRHLEYI